MKIDLDKLFDANKIEINEDVSMIDNVLEYEQVLLSISKTIIKYRKDNKLTQKELAKILDINQVMISKLERGNYNPTIKLLHTISRKLTNSSDLFINMLKDMITSLYKSKNIGYTIQFNKYEIYKNINANKKDNITYLVSGNSKYGGMIYGKIRSTSKFSVA